MINLKEVLPIIVFAVYYGDLGDKDFLTWEYCVEKWEEYFKPALKAEHGGDCTNECYSCARCQAEDCMRLASIIEEGLNDV